MDSSHLGYSLVTLFLSSFETNKHYTMEEILYPNPLQILGDDPTLSKYF